MLENAAECFFGLLHNHPGGVHLDKVHKVRSELAPLFWEEREVMMTGDQNVTGR